MASKVTERPVAVVVHATTIPARYWMLPAWTSDEWMREWGGRAGYRSPYPCRVKAVLYH
jgi:hypothetical protein